MTESTKKLTIEILIPTAPYGNIKLVAALDTEADLETWQALYHAASPVVIECAQELRDMVAPLFANGNGNGGQAAATVLPAAAPAAAPAQPVAATSGGWTNYGHVERPPEPLTPNAIYAITAHYVANDPERGLKFYGEDGETEVCFVYNGGDYNKYPAVVKKLASLGVNVPADATLYALPALVNLTMKTSKPRTDGRVFANILEKKDGGLQITVAQPLEAEDVPF